MFEEPRAGAHSERSKGRGRRTKPVRRANLITHLGESPAYLMFSRVMRRWRASHSSSGNWPFATERNCLYRSVACLVWCNLSCAVAERNRDDGDCGCTLSRISMACKVVVGSLFAEAAKARWLAAWARSSLLGKASARAMARLR